MKSHAHNDDHPPSFVGDLLDLTKPRLSSLVLFTAAGGLGLSGIPVSWPQGLAAVLGTTFAVGGANALNCYLERETDKLMVRTAVRALPSGRLEPRAALIFGLALSLLSVPLLTIMTTPLAGLLAAAALIIYVLLYTPMKRYSAVSTLIGAVPGAMPPLIGWTAATGRLDAGGLALFLLLFLWQIPHSLAISIFRQEEYEKAKLQVFANDFGLRSTRVHILLYTLPLVAMPYLLWNLEIANWLTLIVGTALGTWLLWLSIYGLVREEGPIWARKLFLATLIHLSLLFVTLAVDQFLPRTWA